MKKLQTITHRSAHTGLSVRFETRSVDPANVELLRATVRDGNHEKPLKGFVVSVTLARDEEYRLVGADVQVFQGTRTVAGFVVALTSEVVEPLWESFESFYLRISDRGLPNREEWASPKRPGKVPWVTGFQINCNPTESVLLDHFARAWAVTLMTVSNEELSRGNA